MTEETVNPQITNAGTIAIVVGDEVAMLVGVDEKMYAALKSNPLFIDLKDNAGGVQEKDIYDREKNLFSRPAITIEGSPEILGSSGTIS